MSFSAAQITQLLDLGLTPDQLRGVIEIMAVKTRSPSAERMARKRERDASQSVTCDAQVTRTSDAKVPSASPSSSPPIPPLITTPSPSSKILVVVQARGEIVSDFDDFWKVYPNKVGKPTAKLAYERALRRHEAGSDPPTPQSILAGLLRYTRHKPPDRPWLNPATFLNQERFNDEHPTENLQAGTSQGRPIEPWLAAVDAVANRRNAGTG